MLKPATLSQLRNVETGIDGYTDTATDLESARAKAIHFFAENFENAPEPTERFLFQEDGKSVYEFYIDSGSVDYLYIVIG